MTQAQTVPPHSSIEEEKQPPRQKPDFEVSMGIEKRPFSVLLYGPEKIGKSTFASQAPKPIFIDLEGGSKNLNVARLPKPEDFHDVMRQLEWVATTGVERGFKTVVVDTVDWLEDLIFKSVCLDWPKMVSTIAEIEFGKGYPKANQKWREVFMALEECRDVGLNVILLAHSVVKKFEDPTTPNGYERYQLRLYDGSTTSKTESTAELLKQYVDSLLFANFQVYAADDKRRAFGEGKRSIFTERRPSFDAGNRMGLPFEIPMDFAHFYNLVMSSNTEEMEKLKGEVKDMIGQIKDVKTKGYAEEAFKLKVTMKDFRDLKDKIQNYI